MNFSVFDNDGTMGAAFKTVLLRVYGQNVYWTTFTPEGVRQNVEKALRDGGVGFTYVKDISPTRANRSYVTLAVLVNALNEQSDADVVQIVQAALVGTLQNIHVGILKNEDLPKSWTDSLGLPELPDPLQIPWWVYVAGVGLVAVVLLRR